MKRERTIKAQIVKSRNALVDSLEREDIVIFIEGDLYTGMKKELTTPKQSKKAGAFSLGIGALIIGTAPVIATANIGLGIINMLSGLAKDQIKNYDLINNKEFERIELYLAKGESKYNKDLDTISNYEKSRYEYEDWWRETSEESKIHSREEIKKANTNGTTNNVRRCVVKESNRSLIAPLECISPQERLEQLRKRKEEREKRTLNLQ